MIPPLESPGQTDTPPPKQADVVVIGGGIIGVSTALYLAERGISVALVEKGRIGAEQSGRNWGWVRTAGRDPLEIPLVTESQRLWAEMNKLTGETTGFRRQGILYLCEGQREIDSYESWLDEAMKYQVGSHMASKEEMEKVLPGCTARFAGAMYTPNDCMAEPQKAVPAMARAAIKMGATLHTNCAARGVELKGGRVSGLVTEKGTIACQSVVVAGGVWSRLFLGNLGIDFPQLKLLGSVLATKPLDGPNLTVGASNFAFRKRVDGGYTIARRNSSIAEVTPDSFRLLGDFLPMLQRSWSEFTLRVNGSLLTEYKMKRRWRLDERTPFEDIRILDPEPSTEILEEGLEHLIRNFPFFRDMEIANRWAGYIDATPDGIPVISGVEAIPGLIVSSGYSGHGFGIGPGAGKLTADLVTGHTPIVDPEPFRLDRFPRARKIAA